MKYTRYNMRMTNDSDSQLHLLIDADSWFPRNKNMLAGYLILNANNRQMVSKDFFPLDSDQTFRDNNHN